MNSKNIFDLTNRTVVVTGGGSGLGKAISIGISRIGANVVLVDKDKKAIEKTLEEIFAAGGKAIAINTDVTNEAEVKTMLTKALKEYMKIDVLINCAGITRRMPAEEFNEDDWDIVIDVNLKGTFLCCREVGKHMLQNGSGSIINIASLGAHVAITGSAAYCASKGGVAQLTKTLGVEWAKRGVRVNAISPGVFETPLLKQCIDKEPAYENRMLSKIPMGKFGKPDELVGPAIFLASDASSHVTAHILAVDGGYLAQ